jgi:hypothetical protein
MATLTPKENFRRLGYGDQMPEWVPSWSMGMAFPGSPAIMAGPMKFTMPVLGEGEEMPNMMGGQAGEWKDLWGVPYVSNAETGYAGLPKPGAFILDDVTKWDKVVKWPRDIKKEIAETDWDALAADGLKDINREESGVIAMTGLMPFQELMGLLGFTEGLCAIIEEPEAVSELLNYMADYFVPIIEKTVDYYKPDYLYLLDDTASKYAPFFSLKAYKEIFKPIYTKLTKYGVDRGIPVVLHNCGRCEDQIDDFLDWGVRYWDPAQTDNNLLGIKEKYKGKLAILGGWDYVPNPDKPITEEDIRASVRASIDKYAPGGGYGFAGGWLGKAEDAELNGNINGWIQSEVASYGADFYKK